MGVVLKLFGSEGFVRVKAVVGGSGPRENPGGGCWNHVTSRTLVGGVTG